MAADGVFSRFTEFFDEIRAILLSPFIGLIGL
jgi:hypothetical protein